MMSIIKILWPMLEMLFKTLVCSWVSFNFLVLKSEETVALFRGPVDAGVVVANGLPKGYAQLLFTKIFHLFSSILPLALGQWH